LVEVARAVVEVAVLVAAHLLRFRLPVAVQVPKVSAVFPRWFG
jgi:hypothetical protein